MRLRLRRHRLLAIERNDERGRRRATATTSFNVVVPTGALSPGRQDGAKAAYDGFDDTNGTFVTYVSAGFNFTQMYCSDCGASEDSSFLAAAQAAGLIGGFAYLDQPVCASTGSVADCESSVIDAMAQSSAVAMWGIPEEESDTLSQDKNYYSYIHANDPRQRPVFKYMATHGNPSFLEPIIPYVDIVGEGAYPIYDADCNSPPLPPVLARYAIEQEIAAIQAAGYSVGPDYLPLFAERPRSSSRRRWCPQRTGSGQIGTSPQNWANEVWNGLAAGAKGYIDYEYWPVASGGTVGLAGPSGVFAHVNGLLAGTEAVSEWMVKGTQQDDPTVTVTSGPTTVSNSGGLSFSYPSVRAAAWDWAGTRTLVVVNSADAAVTATVSGLPTGTPTASVLDESRTLSAASGSRRSDSFEALGVHVYKVPPFNKGACVVGLPFDGSRIIADICGLRGADSAFAHVAAPPYPTGMRCCVRSPLERRAFGLPMDHVAEWADGRSTGRVGGRPRRLKCDPQRERPRGFARRRPRCRRGGRHERSVRRCRRRHRRGSRCRATTGCIGHGPSARLLPIVEPVPPYLRGFRRRTGLRHRVDQHAAHGRRTAVRGFDKEGFASSLPSRNPSRKRWLGRRKPLGSKPWPPARLLTSKPRYGPTPSPRAAPRSSCWPSNRRRWRSPARAIASPSPDNLASATPNSAVLAIAPYSPSTPPFTNCAGQDPKIQDTGPAGAGLGDEVAPLASTGSLRRRRGGQRASGGQRCSRGRLSRAVAREKRNCGCRARC